MYLSPRLSPKSRLAPTIPEQRDHQHREEEQRKGMGMELMPCLKEAMPFAGMTTVQLASVMMNTLSKSAMNKGMSAFVYSVYYSFVGVIFLLPYFTFHRLRSKQPPLTLKVLWRFTVIGSVSSAMVICLGLGVKYSNPTLTAALANLSPLFTFLLAIIYGMEEMDLKRPSSVAKCLGTIVLVSGALVMTLYKGPSLVCSSSSFDSNHQLHSSQQLNWILGGFFLFLCYLSAAELNILQTAVSKEYPDKVTIVFFIGLVVSVQCAIFSIFVERNPDAWKLRPDIEIISVLYTGLYVMGFKMVVTIWCLHKKGPLFVAMFEPLGMLIAAIMGVIFLGETLHLGCVVGGLIIAFGFYTIIWGQSQDDPILIVAFESDPSRQDAPLLENCHV